MARVPCSFSVEEEFLSVIDARATQLQMKRSEYIVHTLRKDIQAGGDFTVVKHQRGIRGKQQSSEIGEPITD